MWISITAGIICVTILIIAHKLLLAITSIFTHKYNHELEISKYADDTRLKIEEPVRPVPINEEMQAEILSIKSQLTGLSINQGIRKR